MKYTLTYISIPGLMVGKLCVYIGYFYMYVVRVYKSIYCNPFLVFVSTLGIWRETAAQASLSLSV